MRSIRLSLILYFLLMVGIALGGVSWFCYASTRQALEAKEAKTLEPWQAKYEESCKRVRDNFDRELQTQARGLAGKAVWINAWPEPLTLLGVFGNGPHNYGLTGMLWAAQSRRDSPIA